MLAEYVVCLTDLCFYQKLTFMEFIITVLTVYGISSIVTLSKIFEPLRDMAEKRSPKFWKHLTSCMQCFPFWAGILVSVVMGGPITVDNEMFPTGLNLFFTYLFTGALFSGTTFLIHTLFIFLKGEDWKMKQESERKRKLSKGIVQ